MKVPEIYQLYMHTCMQFNFLTIISVKLLSSKNRVLQCRLILFLFRGANYSRLGQERNTVPWFSRKTDSCQYATSCKFLSELHISEEGSEGGGNPSGKRVATGRKTTFCEMVGSKRIRKNA